MFSVKVTVNLETHQLTRFGDRIREKRLEKKLGLRTAATKLGISAAYLSRIETNAEQNPPAESVINDMAKLFDAEVDEFMQLAGRVSSEVTDYIASDSSMPQFLRTARDKKLSGDDLQKLLEDAGKRGKR